MSWSEDGPPGPVENAGNAVILAIAVAALVFIALQRLAQALLGAT